VSENLFTLASDNLLLLQNKPGVLAEELRKAGANVQFIARSHEGSLNGLIQDKGFVLYEMPAGQQAQSSIESSSPYDAWLGISREQDAQDSIACLKKLTVDWLIVDHYALDEKWEKLVRPYVKNIMAIDDLAQRQHECDLLLDQNMVGDMHIRYKHKTPERCTLLLGPQYALVRPEFNRMRRESIYRRAKPKMERLLVFLGGSDSENETSKVIQGVKFAKRAWRQVDVVVGKSFPELTALRLALNSMPVARLHIQTSEMARLMLDADLAVMAGGSVTWEKCTLGLPSIVVIQGDNQYPIATKMHDLGAQLTVGRGSDMTPEAYALRLDSILPKDLTAMTKSAQAICDGSGSSSVIHMMNELL